MRGLLVVAFAALSVTVVKAASIEPPKVMLVDKNGVDMTNGQVSHVQPTVSIGGAMGLSHSVSIYGNEFFGFRGKYYGDGHNIFLSDSIDYAPREIYRIHDFEGTADFAYYVGNTIQNGGWQLSSGYTYKALGHEGNILEWDYQYLYWTKPNGTVSRYERGYAPTAATWATLIDVTYPNGLVVAVQSSGMSATTNAGFQVKVIYEDDHRDFRNVGDASLGVPVKTDVTTLKNVDPFFTSTASGWSNSKPRYVKAINNAIEYCPPTARDCVLTKKWPSATFNYPPGMPRTLSIGNTTMSVVDMAGTTTWYDFKAFDLAYESTEENGILASGTHLNEYMSPRLVGIRSNGNDRKMNYNYTNVYITQDSGTNTWDIRLQNSGRVIQAKLLDYATTGYAFNQAYYTDAINQAYGSGGIERVQVKGNSIQGNPGAIYFVQGDEGTLYYENTVTRNFPSQFEPINGPTQILQYTRSNLSKIYYQKNLPDQTIVEAGYPASCTSATRKTCNQADWVKDARGNITSYTYHGLSGGIYTITSPPNKNSLVAQTRFEYEQKNAHYYNGGAGKITGSPIWMKVSERSCANSNYIDSTPADGNPLNGACQDADEVVTRYEYNHDNLLMTGMTVTAKDTQGQVQTLRTCMQYDMYGNQIGTTPPNANLSSCQ